MHADKTYTHKAQSNADTVFQQQDRGAAGTLQFANDRSEAVAQRKSQEMANNSPAVKQLSTLQEMADTSARVKQLNVYQRMAETKPNNTGLPDRLKAGIESLSGMRMDHVRVHYNSDKPVQLDACAYAQGSDIHLAAGQEQHLPHEAWHVVQQAQGRVPATIQMKGGTLVNDNQGLEQEADVMGTKALTAAGRSGASPARKGCNNSSKPVAQRWILKRGSNKKIRSNTYQTFPSSQLRIEGVTEAEMPLARDYHDEAGEYYTLVQVKNLVKAEFKKANKGVRVKPQQGKKRLRDMDEVIDYLDNQGADITGIFDHFETKKHKTAFDPVLSLVPVTEDDLDMGVDITKGDLTRNFVTFINQQHVPDMVRTPSMLVDISTSMKKANKGTEGFVSASKGSMFEKWVFMNVVPSSGKITIKKQGGMSQDRSPDGYDKGSTTIYEAKNYESKMTKSTNNNQWFDYDEILTNGYKGTKGEIISDVCYVFPDVATANLNTHLKDTNIRVAYPKKGTTTLIDV